MIKNILLTIEYDGTYFSGWQRQPHQRTVQGELEKTLGEILGGEIKLNGTSRTDAGVHARGQRASFKGELPIPTKNLAKVINNRLTKKYSLKNSLADLRVTCAEEVPLDFHARFNAKGKTYIYQVRNATEPNLFQRNYCYEVSKTLDLDAMKMAANHLWGTHDFKCFQAQGGQIKESTTRSIYQFQIFEEAFVGREKTNDKLITMVVTGDGFLYNMVRIMVGTLIDIGIGRLRGHDIPAILQSRDRSYAGHTAPPQGLYLDKVYFEPLGKIVQDSDIFVKTSIRKEEE